MKHALKLKITIAALGLFVATESFAGGKPPWVVPEKGITEAHRFIAARLKEALAIDQRKQPFFRPARKIKWSTKMRNYGISNIDDVNIKKLFSGHYFVGVYRPPGNKKHFSTERISVRYFGTDGRYYSCIALVKGKSTTNRPRWKAQKKSIGFGGYNSVEYKTSKFKAGLPMIYDGDSGRAVIYYNPGDTRSHPNKFEGHFQKEYAPVFKDVCPNIPNNGSVNAKQRSPLYAELVKDARKIKNIPTRFKQDIDDPLTLGMYFSLYGPDE